MLHKKKEVGHKWNLLEDGYTKRRPVGFLENSIVPRLVGYVAPIEPFAVSFRPGGFFCKRKVS